MNDAEKLKNLKELLLKEDREFANIILQKLDRLEDSFYVDENFLSKINPIIDKKIDDFGELLPEKIGSTITEALSEQIKNSQTKVVEALFPIIGKMVKKYIQQEIKILSDSINAQVQNSLSIIYWQRKLKSAFTGVSEQKMILSSLEKPFIEQIFVIEKGSGLAIASYSKKETIDSDMIAGMLTAIKSFVEDAFSAGNQSLENIKYELYTIHLQDFSSYYIAAIVSGAFNNQFQSDLEDKLIDFGDKYIKGNLEAATIEKNLESVFKNE